MKSFSAEELAAIPWKLGESHKTWLQVLLPVLKADHLGGKYSLAVFGGGGILCHVFILPYLLYKDVFLFLLLEELAAIPWKLGESHKTWLQVLLPVLKAYHLGVKYSLAVLGGGGEGILCHVFVLPYQLFKDIFLFLLLLKI